MQTWVKILAWYTLVVIILNIILAPLLAGGEPLTAVEVVVSTVFLIPVLIFAALTLMVMRRA